jgi:hypothetical protein
MWTFHLYLATFRQHLHMDYISLSWSGIPELVVPIGISLIGVVTNNLNKLAKSWSYNFWKLRLPPWIGLPWRNICHKWPWICSLVVSTSRPFPSSWRITRFVSRVTRRGPQVEQELYTLQEHSRFKVWFVLLDRLFSVLLTRKLLNQWFLLVKLKSSKVLRSPPWLSWPLWNICITNDHEYIPLVVNTSRAFPHSWLITGFVTRLTRRVPLSGAGTACPFGSHEFTSGF